jgi:hypothetical protein
MLLKLVAIAVLNAAGSMLLVSMISGHRTNTTNGVHGSVFGFTTA